MLGCEKPQGATQPVTFSETKNLFEWGFENFESKELVAEGETIEQIEVRLSTEEDKLVLVTDGSLSGTVPSDIDLTQVERTIDVPKSVDAPIEAGQKIGTLSISYNGVDYGTVNLVALSDVSRSEVLYYADKIEHFFQSTVFKILVLVIILLFFVYFTLLVLRSRRKKKRRQQMMKSKQARYREYDKRDRHD